MRTEVWHRRTFHSTIPQRNWDRTLVKAVRNSVLECAVEEKANPLSGYSKKGIKTLTGVF